MVRLIALSRPEVSTPWGHKRHPLRKLLLTHTKVTEAALVQRSLRPSQLEHSATDVLSPIENGLLFTRPRCDRFGKLF